MVRGLDGFDTQWRLCGFEGPPRARSRLFRWLLRGGNTSSHSEQSS